MYLYNELSVFAEMNTTMNRNNWNNWGQYTSGINSHEPGFNEYNSDEPDPDWDESFDASSNRRDAELYFQQLRRKLRDLNSYGAGHSSDHSDDDSYGAADLYSMQRENLGEHKSKEASISESESDSSCSVTDDDDSSVTDDLKFQCNSDDGSD